MVYCDRQLYEKDGKVREDIILNPTVIFEIMSPSSEKYDQGEKQSYYLELPQLKDCVIVAQDRIQVLHYTRTEERTWLVTPLHDLTDEIALRSIECTLSLAEIYENAL